MAPQVVTVFSLVHQKNALFTALRPVLGMLAILAFFSTWSSPYLSFSENPYLLVQLFIWEVPPELEIAPKGVGLNEPSWVPGKSPPLLSSPYCAASREVSGRMRILLLRHPLLMDPSRAVQHYSLQIKNKRLFPLVFTCRHTDQDWQF